MDNPDFPHLTGFVRAVDARVDHDSNVSRVLNHITDNPGVSTRDIVKTLDLSSEQVGVIASRLASQGKVRRCAKVPGEHRARWESGCDPAFLKMSSMVLKPNQRSVSTWDPIRDRDPLVTALFGPPVSKITP